MRSELSAKVPKFQGVKGRRSTGRWEILRYTQNVWLSKNVPSQTLLKIRFKWHIFLARKKQKHIFKMPSPETGPMTQTRELNEMGQQQFYNFQVVLFKIGSFWKRYGYNNQFFGCYLCQILRFLKRFENPFSTNNLHLESALGLMKPGNVQSDFTLIPYPSQNEGSPGGRKSSSETWQSPFFQ